MFWFSKSLIDYKDVIINVQTALFEGFLTNVWRFTTANNCITEKHT